MAFRVVIVEDDFIIQMFLENVVSKLGCKVVGVAESGEKATEIIQEEKPDMILMDIGIQGKIDGVDTALEIKKITDKPIIFLTGNSDKNTLDRAKATNPAYIIFKPIDEERLKEEILRIRDHLSRL